MSNLKRYTLYIINMIDIISIVISYWISYYFRFYLMRGSLSVTRSGDYLELFIVIIIAYVICNIVFLYNDETFLSRGNGEEFAVTLKTVVYMVGIVVVYLYIVKQGSAYSRLFIGFFSVLTLFINYFLRIFAKKKILPSYRNSDNSENVLVVAREEELEGLLEKVNSHLDWRFSIDGVIVVDKNLKGETIHKLPVVGNKKDLFDEHLLNDYDSILVASDNKILNVEEMITKYHELGKVVHIRVKEYDLKQSVRDIDRMGDCVVMNYKAIASMPRRISLFKRLLNLVLGFLFLPIFMIASLIVWVFSIHESPGKILISRVRVGQNNRRFYQYRYRVYRLDAEERIQKGLSPYTTIGQFLEWSHLDGLPEILNVLFGDMNLIGPKAPNLVRYLDMSVKERSTLTINPGIIGYWSCIKNPEDVLEEEEKYIASWSIVKDIYIILSTVFKYFTMRSLRVHGEVHYQEELMNAKELYIQNQPFVYERIHHIEHDSSYNTYLIIKRIFDIVVSLFGIIITSPILLILSILIVMDDGGSPFYGHTRIGKDGKKIEIFKFRSMRKDAGDLEKLLTPKQLAQYRQEFKIDDDPRITRIGQFIRKTSLDELPQLLNILSGNLSLIGPRPIVEKETVHYGDDIDRLLSVKPGLTGYWQAYARNNAVYETGERQKMELYYVDHQSLFLDFKIFFRTFIAVLKGSGAK